MNVLLIDGVEYRIGAKVKDERGNIGVITQYNVTSADDDRPLRVDFMTGCAAHYGPNSEYRRCTLVESKSEREEGR